MRLPGFSAATALGVRGHMQNTKRSVDTSSFGAIEPALHWGALEFGTCDRAGGVMQIGAVLWDIPWGASWEATCAGTPGYNNRVPDSCQNTGSNIKGWWWVPCTGCCP
jgi:hypothetical protein